MTNDERLRKRSMELVEQWNNGNRQLVNDWIGNSATRLLYMIDAFGSSEEQRRFHTAIRVIRNI